MVGEKGQKIEEIVLENALKSVILRVDK